MTSYYLRIRSPRVVGSVALPGVLTLNAAKALAREWAGIFRSEVKVEITNNEGVTQWTL